MKSIIKASVFCLVVNLVHCLSVCAQENPLSILDLTNLSEFKTQAGNWFVVGNVWMDPTIDVRNRSNPKEKSRKKNKHSKDEALYKGVNYTKGTGVLLNINDETRKSNLLTLWEHGDIYIELEVMLPRGSNSGIYLQGRYELQLEDSWGVTSPKFSNMGGIYRNWEESAGKSYMGKAPLTNAAKAPGLWQKLQLSFQAPKFDSAGKKIANAKIISAELNGVKIHENIEIPLPTGGAIGDNEVAKGPLMIQGDHGPVAFRNIRYRHMQPSGVEISKLQYSFFPGQYEDIDDFSHTKPAKTGSSDVLTYDVEDSNQLFGLIYKGNISIPSDNTYTFHIEGGGSVRLFVNEKKLVEAEEQLGSGSVFLKKGDYAFEIQYNRKHPWFTPKLGFIVESPGNYSKSLHTYTSYMQFSNVPSLIKVQPGSEPKLLRAFIDYNGDGNKRLTHTIAVGDPSGVHYIYDLRAGNLVCVWKGDFIDATPMWNSRGDGSFRPIGLTQYLTLEPSLAALANENELFPEKSSDEVFKGQGYELDEITGRPTFRYLYRGAEVKEVIYPDENNKMLTREIAVSNANKNQKMYVKLAEGNSIIQMDNGLFVIGDNQFYIRTSSSKPVIRKLNGKTELILPVEGNLEKYSIIW